MRLDAALGAVVWMTDTRNTKPGRLWDLGGPASALRFRYPRV